MSDEIKVTVIRYSDRSNFVLRYTDPMTGKHKTKSAGTTNERDALKAAGQWQDDLRKGRYRAPSRTTWADFRDRYEREVLAGFAPNDIRQGCRCVRRCRADRQSDLSSRLDAKPAQFLSIRAAGGARPTLP